MKNNILIFAVIACLGEVIGKGSDFHARDVNF